MFTGEDEEDANNWEVVKTNGPEPRPMSHAAGFCSKELNRFYIFGGTTHQFKTFNLQDETFAEVIEKAMLHYLDLNTLQWVSTETKEMSRDDFAFIYE
jgi:hypothetical protein